ncbi:hypothetical protein [Amycolatopsis sacchari]|uniref:hypothetical protein n=1 Tax=Amycolatopsis sacchari TaxID=115433 RepID=UPI003D751455
MRGGVRLIAAAVLGVLLTSCAGGDEEPEPPRATVNPALPAATALSDPATPVPAGTFGVVKSHSTGDTPPDGVLAVKVGKVRRGEAGEFKDVKSLTGNSTAVQRATPYFVNVHYAVLAGDPHASPVRKFTAVDAAGTRANALSVPDSLEKCEDPATEQGVTELRAEQVRCAVLYFDDPAATPAAFVYADRTAYPDGDHAVRFAA